jgi:hypothetical protein
VYILFIGFWPLFFYRKEHGINSAQTFNQLITGWGWQYCIAKHAAIMLKRR